MLVTICLALCAARAARAAPLILIVVPLSAISLAGIGALIGSSARTPQEAGSISLLTTLVLVGLGPVVVPPGDCPV